MRKFTYSALSLALGAGASASSSSVLVRAYADRSPIYGAEVPPDYRKWQLVAISHEEGLNELRGILGNSLAMKAYRDRKLPFPISTVLVKVAGKRVALPKPAFDGAYVTDAAGTVQIMVKGSTQYAATGGLGFGRFIGGNSVDEVQDRTCAGRHEAYAAMHDGVFAKRPLKQRSSAHSL